MGKGRLSRGVLLPWESEKGREELPCSAERDSGCPGRSLPALALRELQRHARGRPSGRRRGGCPEPGSRPSQGRRIFPLPTVQDKSLCEVAGEPRIPHGSS